MSTPPAEARLVAECRARALALLSRNLARHGMRAATPSKRASARAYTAVFARDAAICALAMAASGDAPLARRAHVGLDALARGQAPSGQLPNFVAGPSHAADFWYVGCIDATLWWLVWLDVVDRARGDGRLAARHAASVARAIGWLRAQEHPRFGLLQQNEASDWADIMPRSGFVLYTNALWCEVKRRFRVPGLATTRRHLDVFLRPSDGAATGGRRARLLAAGAARAVRDPDLYLSFVNLGTAGAEGDAFGNVLAVALGLVRRDPARRLLDRLRALHVADRFPIRSVCRPIRPGSPQWRPYMLRHRQNLPWQYHNGGVWPLLGGFWVIALVQAGRREQARAELARLARACRLGGWSFPEWLHGRTYAPRGMAGQSFSAAAFLLAERAVRDGRNPLRGGSLRQA